ncbi:nuclear receptor 2C2-associated protein isoform X3 [Dromiciops gliroides]|uniref:nuclear receptor 2C2-associated protein isoform X3 n=1 Tax=Dromiciops gliroides TaxID=33562 RepID=UPI001CC6C32A|nr:nuclear receptor 2C2-associated protein isoform X3 [Dromiciops gliroides]
MCQEQLGPRYHGTVEDMCGQTRGRELLAMATPMPLVCGQTVSRVSSVLNRDVKQFGKKHLFDEQDETCWNSDQVAGRASPWRRLEISTPKTTTPSRYPLLCARLGQVGSGGIEEDPTLASPFLPGGFLPPAVDAEHFEAGPVC